MDQLLPRFVPMANDYGILDDDDYDDVIISLHIKWMDGWMDGWMVV